MSIKHALVLTLTSIFLLKGPQFKSSPEEKKHISMYCNLTKLDWNLEKNIWSGGEMFNVLSLQLYFLLKHEEEKNNSTNIWYQVSSFEEERWSLMTPESFLLDM